MKRMLTIVAVALWGCDIGSAPASAAAQQAATATYAERVKIDDV